MSHNRRLPPIPRITGTKFDAVINELVDVTNKTDDPRLTVCVVVGISKFLVLNHEMDVGPTWAKRALEITNRLRIRNNEFVDRKVDEICEMLGQRAKPWWRFW